MGENPEHLHHRQTRGLTATGRAAGARRDGASVRSPGGHRTGDNRARGGDLHSTPRHRFGRAQRRPGRRVRSCRDLFDPVRVRPRRRSRRAPGRWPSRRCSGPRICGGARCVWPIITGSLSCRSTSDHVGCGRRIRAFGTGVPRDRLRPTPVVATRHRRQSRLPGLATNATDEPTKTHNLPLSEAQRRIIDAYMDPLRRGRLEPADAS